MTIEFEKVAEAIEKSSQEIKDLMFSTELADRIGIIAEENKLEEEVALKLFDEIGYVILDLKSRLSFFDSLVEIGIEKNAASTIANEVESKVFSELNKIKKEPERREEKSGVGENFEQIILNQAKAMQPARPADESGRIMNYESRIMGGKEQTPSNLPIEPTSQPEIHDYKGEDPYREPLG